MQDVYLGLGSNLGDREQMLRAAITAIDALPSTKMCESSGIYETPPMGPQDQGAYLNMAVHVQSAMTAVELVANLQKIEIDLGRADRQDRRHWGPREIDLDVLLIGDTVINEPGLTVPHPGMHQRWFVLKPLAEIAPDLMHPVLHQAIETLLTKLDQAVEQEATP